MAVLSILGALLGAGGSIAGGILSKPEDPKTILPPFFNAGSDPLSALNALDVMASQGVFAPSSILSQAGPLQQAIQQFAGTTPLGGRNRDRSRRAQAIADFMAGRSTSAANAIAQAGGFGSVREAHQAQQQFKESIGPRLRNLQEIASLSRGRSLDVSRQLSSLTRGLRPLDFESLRESEEQRLQRDLGQRQTDLLRQANVGGFNPGRGLEGIQSLRSDAGTQAITNAIQILSGQTGAIGQQANLLQLLDPTNRAQSLAPGIIQQRTPQMTGQPQVIQGQVDPFGAAVASAAQQIGGTVASIPALRQSQETQNLLHQLLIQGSKPTV